MLGFQYVVAKSRELSSVVERELSAASIRSPPFIPDTSASTTEVPSESGVPDVPENYGGSSRNEGQTFLRIQQKIQAQTVVNHQKLMLSGKKLDSALSEARATLQAQAASEHFLARNFHLISKVRERLEGVRTLVLQLAEEADEVETLLVQRCEESAARQNAEFAAKQQHELEKFEMQIAQESEGRKRKVLELKRQRLYDAFMNDLQAYQKVMHYDEYTGGTKTTSVKGEKEQVTLDDFDLIVTADPDQLAAFYESGSEQDEEGAGSFSKPNGSGKEEEKRELDMAEKTRDEDERPH